MEKDSLDKKLPWENRLSIFRFVQNPLKYVTDEDEFDCLPDRIPLRHDVGMYFPAYDDYMDYYQFDKEINPEFIKRLADKFQAYVNRGNINAKIEFYNLLKGFPIINYHRNFIDEISKRRIVVTPQIKELGRWMVMEAPDREVVKMGIILLGVSHDIESIPLLKSIAKHGEFTYYVGLALYEMIPQWDLMRIDIIEPLYYWGRVMAVTLLLDYSLREEVRKWCVRYGFRHNYSPDYNIADCMKQGDILKDMRKEKWDEPLLRAVQVYVVFLLENARYSYKNGGEVIRLYLKYTIGKRRGYVQFHIIRQLCEFLKITEKDKTFVENLNMSEEDYSDIWIDVHEEIQKPWFQKLLHEDCTYKTYPYTTQERLKKVIQDLGD